MPIAAQARRSRATVVATMPGDAAVGPLRRALRAGRRRPRASTASSRPPACRPSRGGRGAARRPAGAAPPARAPAALLPREGDPRPRRPRLHQPPDRRHAVRGREHGQDAPLLDLRQARRALARRGRRALRSSPTRTRSRLPARPRLPRARHDGAARSAACPPFSRRAINCGRSTELPRRARTDHRRRRHHRLAPRRPGDRGRGARDRRPRQLRPRPPREPRLGDGERAASQIVEGDIRDRDARARARRAASTSSSTRPRSASRSAPRSRGSRSRCSSTAPSTWSRPRRRRACASSSPPRRPRSTGSPRQFPTTESHHPYANDTLYGAAKVFNEGLLRSFHAMYGLDYVALRYFNVYGPRMDVHGALHRGAHPLDGAHRGRRAAAHPRRRHADDGLRLRRATSRAPTCSPRSADVTDEVFNVASGVETSLLELAAGAAARSMGSDLPVEHGPERAVNGVRAAWPTPARPASGSGFEAEVDLEEGLRRLVDWWRAERAAEAAALAVASMMHVPFARPRSPARTEAAVAEVDRARAGCPRVRASRRSRRRSPTRVGAPDAVATSELHHRAAPGAATSSGVGPGRRGHRPVAVVHRHRQRGLAVRRDAGLRRHRPADLQPRTRPSPSARSPRAPRRSCRCTRSGCPADMDAFLALADALRARARRGRRVRDRGARTTGRPIGSLRAAGVLLAASAQGHHHRRGRHDHRARPGGGRAPARAAPARDGRLRPRAPQRDATSSSRATPSAAATAA